MTTSALFGLLLVVQASAPGPEQFFVGRTASTGTARVFMSGSHNVRDRSRGRIEQGNVLILEQDVEEEGKPARHRTWRLVRSAGNRITGTISDARGPVTGEVSSNVIHLRYQSAEGPGVEQWITLRPGGRTAVNRMVFRRLGVTVATVDSVIWRVD